LALFVPVISCRMTIKENVSMMILVRYLDGTYDMVLERHLDSLI